ncbi:hypothetical protein V8F20_006033 [Naviculisporaceae sp. PSN 640]
MTDNHILSLAPELLCQVLASCESIQQVISLSIICKSFYSVWITNSSAILPSVAPRCIPGFDEALIASRVTSLVKNVILDGKTPPRSDDIDIASFLPDVSRPTVSDMPYVMHLHKLANLVEKAYLDGSVGFDRYDINWGMEKDKSGRGLPSREEWNQNLKQSFHRAIFRVFLAGPVIAGWYLEPFSTNGTPNILPPDMPLRLRMFVQDLDPEEPEVELKDEDFAYLERKSIAFDQTINARLSAPQGEIFGSLSSWLISSIREHVTPQDMVWAQEKWPTWPENLELFPRLSFLELAGATLEETRAALREVMRMVVAYEYLANMISNFHDGLGHGRDGNEEDFEPLNIFPNWPQSSTTTAIILGVYQLEDLRIVDGVIVASPGILEPSTSAEILGGEHVPLPVDINRVLDAIYRESGRVNCINGALTPPPNLQLFTYILDRYFGLQFSEGYMFETRKYNSYFDNLLDNATVFNNCYSLRHPGRWVELLRPRSESRVYSYRLIS